MTVVRKRQSSSSSLCLCLLLSVPTVTEGFIACCVP
jgi:hypothetical protein